MQMNIRFEPRNALPSVLLSALSWVEEVRAPRRLAVFFGRSRIAELPIVDPLIAESPRLLVETLARVQELTRTFFAFPDDLSGEEWRKIAWARRVLEGERVNGTWTHAQTQIEDYDQDSTLSFVRPEGRSLQLTH